MSDADDCLQFDSSAVSECEHAAWSRAADDYAGGFARLTGDAAGPLLDAAGVAPGTRVLDVATGTGLVAARAHSRGSRVEGIDFSQAMIDAARALYPEISFQVGDATSLPFADRTFDAVVIGFGLHHLGRPGAALLEAHRVLKPGGRVAFTVWGRLEELEAFGIVFQALAQLGEPDEPPPHGPLFGVSDFAVFENLLTEAGFSAPKVEDLAISWRLDAPEDLFTPFVSWAGLDGLPAGQLDAVRSAVVKAVGGLAKAGAIPNPAILASASKG